LARGGALLNRQFWKSCIAESTQMLLRSSSTAISDTKITYGHRDVINKLNLTSLDIIHSVKRILNNND